MSDAAPFPFKTPLIARDAATTGGSGRPCLATDFNDLRTEPGCDIYAATDSWSLDIGQSVIVRDSEGLKCLAVVCGPWLSERFVGVKLVGEFDYSECECEPRSPKGSVSYD